MTRNPHGHGTPDEQTSSDSKASTTDPIILMLVLSAPVVLFLLIAFPYILFFRYTANGVIIWSWSIGCTLAVLIVLIWAWLKIRSKKRATVQSTESK